VPETLIRKREFAKRTAILWAAMAVAISGIGLNAQKPPSTSKPGSRAGQQIFASTCAGCHGLDGRGSERAPNIAGNPKVQRMTDAQIFRIVSEGKPGTGMPAFHSVSESERHAVVRYLRTLQGPSKTATLPGNPVEGKSIFFGKAGCADCHMVAGEGGFLGSELSSYARGKPSQQIRDAILNPEADPDPQKKVAVVVTRDGARLTGILRNQDNFSVQLQTSDGRFHFFQKSEVSRIEMGSQTLMPSDYREKLSGRELDNLVSYLMNVAKSDKTVRGAREEE
jgi:cytochrome c oxidase cbb3-type subunit III